MLPSPCRAGPTASALLWLCLGGQALLVSRRLLFASASVQLSQVTLVILQPSLVFAGKVPKDVHTAMQQLAHAQPESLQQHLSASQYMHCLVSAAGMEQLRLCQQQPLHKAKVAAFCVDHKLRREGQSECQQAATQASDMGLESRIMQMQWPQLPATGHLMEQASIVRYQLLQQICKASNISVLMTGHHAGTNQ